LKLRADYNNKHYINIDERIAIISDTHLTSEYEAIFELHSFYSILYNEGIKQVFHAGDLSDGMNVYQNQMYEQKVVGADKQLEYIIKKYPRRKGIKTYFIGGNHDCSYSDKFGYDFLEKLDSRRRDLHYLGPYYAKIRDETRDFEIDLLHLKRGRTYAISYPAQAFLRDFPHRRYPNLMILGHRHRAWYGMIQEVHCFEAGNFQKPTPYAIERGQGNPICGWILEFDKDLNLENLKMRLINFGYGYKDYL